MNKDMVKKLIATMKQLIETTMDDSIELMDEETENRFSGIINELYMMEHNLNRGKGNIKLYFNRCKQIEKIYKGLLITVLEAE